MNEPISVVVATEPDSLDVVAAALLKAMRNNEASFQALRVEFNEASDALRVIRDNLDAVTTRAKELHQAMLDLARGTHDDKNTDGLVSETVPECLRRLKP